MKLKKEVNEINERGKNIKIPYIREIIIKVIETVSLLISLIRRIL